MPTVWQTLRTTTNLRLPWTGHDSASSLSRLVSITYTRPHLSPRSDILNLGLTKSARLGRLIALDAICTGDRHGLPRHDISQNLVFKIQYEAIDLLKLEQKGVVALAAVDGLERRVWDRRGEILLLGVGEEAVGLDSQD